ncbi:Nucleolar protein [Quillaja saponaria]|uniref:Nucleolar protein n=1 Tax=Quillaja saponaria TaxID=32244 RepID=A0AAD7M4C9_QUISA|nr:Nucleolar protein [Quillaja saponaria]
MARQLLLMHSLLPSTLQIALAVMTLLLCATALFMCASHSHKWRCRWRACYSSCNENPVIELNNDTMIIQPGGLEESTFSCEQGASLWQKNILMGGKCQLLEFSGVIIYDSDGNVVTPAKTSRPLLTWK